MSTEVKLRRGTAAQHANFIGAPGEITYVTDEDTIRIHDGATPGGREVSDAELRQEFDAHKAETAQDDVHDLLTNGKIIESRGSNSDGEWIRFADGTQICFSQVFINLNTNELQLYPFPIPFIDQYPSASISFEATTSVNRLDAFASVALMARGASVQDWRVSIREPVADENRPAGLLAVGRWK